MDALSKLLNLSPAKKESLGVVHTLPEILQQLEVVIEDDAGNVALEPGIDRS